MESETTEMVSLCHVENGCRDSVGLMEFPVEFLYFLDENASLLHF